jgi:NOL1/NOP2/fmu family ribosome biogenesis protein
LQGEGFFMSIFRKRTGHSSHIPSARAEDHRKLSFLKPFISLEKKCILTQKDNLIAIHENHRDLYTALSAHIKLIKKGIMLGKVIRNELIPDHELAMYAECAFEDRIELSLENAISYLKKDELAISSDTKGWKLVTYNKIPLGWIKQLGNRNNNYFPSNYRILSKNILPF